MTRRPTPRLALLLAHCVLVAACGAGVTGRQMTTDTDSFDRAWQAVQDATTPEQQREHIDAFLQHQQEAGSGPLLVRVQRRDSGEKAAIDKALWEHPERYLVSILYGQRQYDFVPLSRLSLEPLFRE